ncbi:T9SS type B sorting domain-containing protein [Flavobacterium sp. N1994]|uniref:T9SS type B sorting domain-containing protein n=1 Tax=Flavobacterium sp. N1994 TaxID=2986827 RepID=UPI0022239929|nr:T9SS type B sorting domain-containing protein [Flavobacterium sp. N1994]
MKHITFLYKKIITLLLLLISFQSFSQNLLVNGNFETGSVVGFFSNGAGYVRINPPFSGTTTSGNWAFTTDPQTMNTASFISCVDHTTGTGYMLVFDGNTTGGQQNFWEAGNGGGGVCSLTIGATYTFSYWIRSVYGPVAGSPTPADIGVNILNASSVTLVSGNPTAPPTANGWQQVVYTFVPTSACVNIKLFNNNTNAVGNDFAIDDMSVTAAPQPLAITYSSTNSTCPNANNGSIVINGVHGITPYVSYSISGTASQTNTTGIFTGLGPGTYSISVTDSNIPPVTASLSNIIITEPANLNVSASPTTMCSGSSTSLSASGSTGTYNWTSLPVDASLSATGSSQNVSPTQTTTYTVTSASNSTAELIFNGDFTQGNTGFTTDYQYLTVTVPSGTQKTYGIVTNSNAWFAGFSSCTAHGGAGNMMAIDGSNLNAGNDRVWCQTVPVVPGQNYNFSYWIQTVATPNSANIDVLINGISIGSAIAPAATCGWVQRTYVWNSGASTTAQICLYDRVITASGNDFALDDISFTGAITCNLSNSVTVTVNQPASPSISCGTSTSNSVVFNWGAVSGATGYTISYTINGGSSVSGGSTTNTSYPVTGLNPNDSVAISVTPTGVGGCFAVGNATCIASLPCPVPTVTVTQPTCLVSTGSIVFTGPINPAPLPAPTDLFISEVSDEDVGSLTYVEIFNGTGTTKNLANYRLKVYNNGSGTASCDLLLSGSLASNAVAVVAIGSATNQGGVLPNLVFAGCGGVNTDDNIRLTTSGNVEIDLWGRTDGIAFTPANSAGYSFRRLVTVPHPSLTWNPADWTALDPQDYTNIGTFIYQTANYQYSVNGGTTYQVGTSFTGLTPGNYNAQIKDLVSGCISNPIPITLNALPALPAPTVSPITYCQNATAAALTATPSAGGTLNWYGTNATGGVASATAPTPLTTGALGSVVHYFVSQTIGGCESPRADIAVTIGNNAPTATPFLFCDAANTTTTQVAFDFNNVGQTSFSYSYSINGGPPVTGTQTAPSHFNVPVTGPGQGVAFTLTWNGVCTPSQTNTCYSTCAITPVLSIHNPAAVCSPNTVDITLPAVTAGSTGGGGISYWTDATATTALTNPSAITTSGTYYIKSALGGCYDIKPVVVTINPSPSLTITNPAAVCSPNTVDITLPAVTAGSTGAGTLTYWTNVTATTSFANPTSVSASGTYYIKSTVGSCFDIKPVTVTISTTPVLTITNPVTVCSPNTIDITLPAVTAGSTGGGTLTYWTNATATTALANPTSVTSGTYYIKSTLGSCFDIKPVVVTITTTPVLSIHNPAAVCSPNTVDITLPAVTTGSTGGGTLTYWTNVTATTSLANPTSVSSSGTYYIKSTVGSCFDIKPVTVTISTTPVLTITNPSTVCSPNTVDITLPAVTAGSTGGGTLTYWTNATATTALANPTSVTSGTYYIKSTLGSCFDIKPVVVTITTTPVLSINNPAAVCLPNTVDITLPAVTAGSTGVGTLTYWTNATATTSLTNPTSVSASGTYYIKSTVGSCFDIKPVTVTINTTPVLIITNPATVCSPNTVDITLPAVTVGSTVGGTLTYWADATATTALLNPTTVSVSGTYYIKSTVGSCFDIKPVTVTISNPNLQITNPATVCLPGTVNITLPAVTVGSTGGGILSYWIDAAATIPLPNPTAIAISGIYYIKSTVGSCFDIKPVTVSINANFTVNTPLPLQDCDPNNDGFVTFDLTQVINSITGGNPIYTVSFHETVDDAFVNGTTIPTPSNYDNIYPFLQTIYIRVNSSSSSCYQIIPFQLIVNKTPVATQPTPYALCDYTGAVGFETFDLTTKINEILGSINPALTSVSFYTSQSDADAGTNAITSISSYVNASPNTQTLYVRVETIATGCYDVVTLQLVVNPIPNSLQPNYPQYSLCDVDQSNIGFETFDLGSKINDILLGQTGMTVRFYISLGDAQNGTNEITNLLYQNQIQYVQTLGISITNNATGCSVISTMDIRVEPLPSLIPPTQPYTLCDDDQDGFTTFDLTSLLPGLLNSITTYTVSFHETPQDAASNGTTIPNPAQYININPFVQIIYARAEDNLTHCVSVIPIELDVNPSPKPPVSLVDITVCDTDNNPQDASTRVDLTQLTASVLSQQPLPATAYSVTYYTSLALAQVGTAPIIPDTNYVGSNGQTIWVRVENNVTHCYNIGTFLLHINTPLLLTTPTPLSLCDDDANPNNQYHTFDLTVKNAQITQGLLGYTVTYYPSLLEAQTHTNPITTPTAYQNDLLHPAVQTLGVVVSSPAPANCESITTLDIRVLPIPTPNTNPPALAPKCDDNNPGDMLEYFDLTVNESYIRNNDPNLSFHYFPTQADAENNIVANEILTPTNALVGTNVWIRVENTRVDYQGNHCYVLVEQALKVNPLPTVVQPLAPYRVCDNDTDGLAPFDLTNPLLAPQILGAAQATTDFTISYYLTAAGANPLTNTGQLPLVSPYTNVTANSQNIYIRVVNNTTGCTNTGVLTLAVEQYATATGPQTFAECDNYNDPYDGIHQIDLTQYATAILNGQSPTVFLVSYYTSLADATAGTNALTLAQAQAYQTDPDTDTIWVKVENSSNTITPLCYAITTIDITVERYPNPIIVTNNGVNTICVNFDTNAVVRPLTLDSGIANPGNYTFEWFEDAATTPIAGATGPTYTVNTSSATGATRNYTVHVTSNSALACDSTSASFAVIQSGQASIPTGTIGYTVTNAFTEQQIITVLIQGYGTYEYSLDDGPRQASTIFDSVSLGTHVIHVWDTEGGIAYSCEELIIEDVQIIDYPHYFTPNGDGIHDTWNIVGLGGQPDARIYIFDRYGKLLKQISSTGDGWDGTFNGHLLPSDDYWFSVDYIENATAKQFKAHFTLKR